ncbi:MAG: hypothetical protein IK075_04880, partial [Prevotella sp.]|nr:hypothetical protein [Prevotella sp.]
PLKPPLCGMFLQAKPPTNAQLKNSKSTIRGRFWLFNTHRSPEGLRLCERYQNSDEEGFPS